MQAVRLYVVVCAALLAVAAGSTTPCPVTSPSSAADTGTPTLKAPPPFIKQCFHEGRWYRAGDVVNIGQSDDWCYGAICDFDGHVKFWDNYNCRVHGGKPKPTQPRGTWPQLPVVTTPPPLFTLPAPSKFDQYGCWYRGHYYLPGSDIMNGSRGMSCYGVYCDFNSRVKEWQDSCYNTVAPHPTEPVDWT